MSAHSRRPLASASLALAALALPACTSPPARAQPPAETKAEPAPGPAAGDDAATDPVVARLIAAHNRERSRAGLPPLKPNAKLQAAARVQADDMAEHDKMSHEGSDGSTPQQRIERQGYRGRASGENVAEGQDSVDEVMDGWMHSPPHKKNILGDFGEIGAARASSKDGTPYWCVDFGLPWPTLDADRATSELLDALNRARKEADRPPLRSDPRLAEVARAQARSMADRHKLDAKGPGGASPFEQINQTGYRYRQVNLAFASGVPSAADAARTWLDNRAQRKVILGDASDIGLGVASAPDGTPYWCLILAEPLDR